MMTGRPNQTQRISILAAHDPVDRVPHRAGGERGHVVGLGADDRVAFDLAAPTFRERLRFRDVFGRVNRRQLCRRKGFPSDVTTTIRQTGGLQLVRYLLQSLGPFGMIARAMVEKTGIGIEDRHSSMEKMAARERSLKTPLFAKSVRKTPYLPTLMSGEIRVFSLTRP